MTLRTLANVVATATGVGELSVGAADVMLDESKAPYVEAHLTVNLPDEETIVALDPYADPPIRVVVTATQTTNGAEVEREFDLILHAIELDADSGTATLTLESDEALLIDGGNASASADTSAETFQDSLRDIADDLLDTYGAALEAGTEDADFTITTDRTNLILNPSGEVDATLWAAGTGTSAVARSNTVGGKFGSWAIRGTCSASSSNIIAADTGAFYSVAEGDEYTFTVWIRSEHAQTATLNIQWWDASSGGSLLSTSSSVGVTTSTSVWTLLTLTATAPAGAKGLYPYAQTTGNTSGHFHYLDGAMLIKGSALIDYFDGDTNPDPTHYDVEWEGTAHASRSNLIRLDSRSATILQVQPGQTHWDFLYTLVKTAGLRLFCDEDRKWRLVDPLSYAVDGEVRIAEMVNALAGTDSRSLQATDQFGDPLWFSGLVVRYRWIGDAGESMEEFDAAGTGRKVHRVDVDGPYPGPGAAALILAQADGRGRTQTLTARNNLATTPGMTLISTLPGIPVQVGIVSSVKWAWAADANGHDEMTVKSRGLLETPDEAWLFAEGTWTSVSPIKWVEIDGTGE